jgi:DNA-binding transcriptional MerR regulator
LGLVRIGTDRLLRLELMKRLKGEGYNSKEISEFLNINGIKTIRNNNLYTPKLVWVTLKKYHQRLERIGNNRIIQFKEGLYISPPHLFN